MTWYSCIRGGDCRGCTIMCITPAIHGTTARYKRGCRCAECKTAAYRAAARRTARLSRQDPPTHGTVNGFDRYGCRCEPCRQANAARCKAYRQRRRAAA